MVIKSNIFISNISVDDLNVKLNLYKVDNINDEVIKNDFRKQNSMAYQLSNQLGGVYIFSREQNGFIGLSYNTDIIVQTKDFKYNFIKSLNFNELNNNDILNYLRKILSKKLYQNFMSLNSHNFYFKNAIKHDKFIEFEGFNIVYKILSNRKIIMSLDVSNKFFNAISLMEELKDNFKRYEFISRINKFGKVALFYKLDHGKIIEFDKLSEKKPPEISIDNENIIDYIKSKYHIEHIDNDQYVLESKGFFYLSQFLHSAYDIKYIKNKIMLKPFERYKKIINLIKNYSLDRIYINKEIISFKEMELNQNNIILKKPELLFNNNIDIKYRLFENLKSGFYYTKYIKNMYIYSELSNIDTNNLYNKFVKFSFDNYKYILPEKYIKLEHTKNQLHNQLQKINNNESAAIVISDKEDIYKEFAKNNKLVFKAIYPENAKKIVNYNGRSLIDNFLLSLYARFECKPWLLKEINYNNYAFTDVSRGVAKYMAYTLIKDKNSNIEINTGQPQKGESLSEDNLDLIFDNFIMENINSIIYVRDGSISKSELELIKNNYINNFEKLAVIEYQKNVNYRLFSYIDDKIMKPKNGTCIRLDENNYIIVTTGDDEYKNLHVTPTTKLITIKNSKGSYDINKILSDLFSMCFLNWVSPLNNFSDPAPVHYMDNLLNDMGNNINRSFIPY